MCKASIGLQNLVYFIYFAAQNAILRLAFGQPPPFQRRLLALRGTGEFGGKTVNEKKTGDWKVILGGIVLIVVLFISIKLIFWGLDQAIPKQPVGDVQSVQSSQSVPSGGDTEAPSFCVHCGKELPDSFQWGQFCPYCGKKVE